MWSAFKSLIVWQKSYTLSLDIYKVTAHFPQSEQFSLVNQMRRAVISISSNIAEWSGKWSNIDYARFLKIARWSSLELESQILIAQWLEFIENDTSISLQSMCNEIQKMLNAMIYKYTQ